MVNQPIGDHGLGIFGVVRFELGTPPCQMQITKPKSAYKSLIIGPRGLGW